MGSLDQTTNLDSTNISLLKRKTKKNYWSRETSFSVKKSKQKLHNTGEENWREQDLQIRSLI